MQRTIIKKLNNNVKKLGKTLNIFTYLESLKILMLRIEAGGHLALECLWILDSFPGVYKGVPPPPTRHGSCRSSQESVFRLNCVFLAVVAKIGTQQPELFYTNTFNFSLKLLFNKMIKIK